eukprot:gene15985-7317_t
MATQGESATVSEATPRDPSQGNPVSRLKRIRGGYRAHVTKTFSEARILLEEEVSTVLNVDKILTKLKDKEKLLNVNKFRHLKTLLEGPAATAISGIQPTNANYSEAVELLQNRFAQRQLIINAHMEVLLNLKQVSSERDLDTTYSPSSHGFAPRPARNSMPTAAALLNNGGKVTCTFCKGSHPSARCTVVSEPNALKSIVSYADKDTMPAFALRKEIPPDSSTRQRHSQNGTAIYLGIHNFAEFNQRPLRNKGTILASPRFQCTSIQEALFFCKQQRGLFLPLTGQIIIKSQE